MRRTPTPPIRFVLALTALLLGCMMAIGAFDGPSGDDTWAAEPAADSGPAERSPGDELAVPIEPEKETDDGASEKEPAEAEPPDATKPKSAPQKAAEKPGEKPAAKPPPAKAKDKKPEAEEPAAEPRRPQVVSLPPPEPSYQRAELPPLLEFDDGKPVAGAADWPERRREIVEAMQTYFIGTIPEEPPLIVQARRTELDLADDGSRRERIALELGTPSGVTMEICLWTPSGQGPFPLLLTPPRYYQLAWAEAALKRGYMVCLYPGVDSHHREDDYPGYESFWEDVRAQYPEATWTEMAVKAWLAGRALDYLLDPTSVVDVNEEQIGITGFSRYGKQAMIAAALDWRIRCVVARSPGSPGSCPYRFTSRDTFGESPEVFPGMWFLPSLRSYEGRENQLPIDAHGWLALIAPRHCVIHTAYNDFGESTFAVERAYREGHKVYKMLGHPDRLRIDYREGQHTPVTEAHIQRNLDCMDRAFDRGDAIEAPLPEELIHTFDWNAWKAAQPPEALEVPFEDPEAATDADRVARIRWALGQPPEEMAREAAGHPGDNRETDRAETAAEEPTAEAESETAHEAETADDAAFYTPEESEMMWHDVGRPEPVARVPVRFGDGVRGNIYYHREIEQPAPAVVWLHPYSYPSGYCETWAVNRGQFPPIYQRLAQEGFVVLAYDQCGFGLRLLEGRRFYDDSAQWSLLGRMVYDLRGAVDLLAEGRGEAAAPLPPVDAKRIYTLGYAMGGMLALYGTALDERIAGAASFCGFTPLRADTADKPTGGVRRLWQWHALVPRLGLFQGREGDIPYDYDDVLRLIAPRPCLIVSPTRDRQADCNEVVACVEHAREAWRAEVASSLLTHLVPDGTNRFELEQHETFLHWFENLPAPDGEADDGKIQDEATQTDPAPQDQTLEEDGTMP
jgi:dienelactone hydrolase